MYSGTLFAESLCSYGSDYGQSIVGLSVRLYLNLAAFPLAHEMTTWSDEETGEDSSTPSFVVDDKELNADNCKKFPGMDELDEEI
jgi:hypothetical protein